MAKYVRSRYVKSLEERLRKTESLLRAAGIAVEDDAEDDSSVDDDDSLSSNHHDPGRDAESRSTAGRATGEKGLSKSENPEQPFDSNALAKFYRRKRPTAKNTPPVYRAEKGYSMYHGTPAALLVALRVSTNSRRTMLASVATDQGGNGMDQNQVWRTKLSRQIIIKLEFR